MGQQEKPEQTPNIIIRSKNIDGKIIDFIYEKQAEYRKERKRLVSLDKTIERLLREAYFKDVEQVL